MSEPVDLFELLDAVDECLIESDWDRLAAITSPPFATLEGLSKPQIEAALEAVTAMQAQLQEHMDSIAAELETVPTIRKAARAYLLS